jgi:hypothetical protein
MRPLTAIILLAACAACGGGAHDITSAGDNYNPYGLVTTGPGLLTVSPIDTSQVIAASPLGSLAPPGHVLPTDHVYISFVDPWNGNQFANDCSKRPIRAAGAGVVDFILATEARGDTKVDVQMTKTFHYYYDHVLLLPWVKLGTHVAAGDTIGTTTGFCPSFDLGVWDTDVTPPHYVNTARYAGQTLHVVSPYKYMSAELQQLYYSRSRLFEGVPIDKDGRTDFGVPGHLAGDWFHSSLPIDAGVNGGPDGWPRSIAFAYYWYDRSPRVSIGGTIAPPGLAKIGPTDPDFAAVDPSSGVVAYQLTATQGALGNGWLLVQMTASDKIRIEFFAGATTRPAAFTASAQDYLR